MTNLYIRHMNYQQSLNNRHSYNNSHQLTNTVSTVSILNPRLLHPMFNSELHTKLNSEDDEYDYDIDLAVLSAEAEPEEPPLYAVVMFNDDYTPMEFVVMVLMSEFRHSEDQAIQIMLSIHNTGRGIAGIYAKDIAETKAKKVNGLARREGFPLLTQIEPSQSN